MRPRTLHRRLGVALLGAIIAGATIGTGIAKADPLDDYVITNAPIVCGLLDDYPSVAGVEGVAMALLDKGLDPKQAGEVLVRAVVGWCPSHTSQIDAFIAKWSTAKTVRA